MAQSFSNDVKDRLGEVFGETFDRLQMADEDILRRWDAPKKKFTGGFLNTSYEALAIGLGYLLTEGRTPRTDLRDAAIEFWNEPEMTKKFATGKSTEARLRLMVPKGREILSS